MISEGIDKVHWPKMDLKNYTSTKPLNLIIFFPMFLFNPPENIRKSLVFCFQRNQKDTS